MGIVTEGSTWGRVAWALMAALVTPFLITGMFRILPHIERGLWFPFFAMFVLAFVLWFAPAVPRSVSLGILGATIVWAGFLVWVVLQWSSAPTD